MSRPSPATRRSTKTEYIETDTGNKISRRAFIEGKQNIMLGGKTVIMAGVYLRGDLCRKHDPAAEGEKEKPNTTAISIGRSTVVSSNCTIRPPMRLHKGQMTFIPMRIGDNVFIGPNTHVSSASISSHVHIGQNCVLSPLCIIKESSKVLPDTVVPPGMTVPAGTIVGGRPARILGEVGDGWGQGGGGEGEEWVQGGDLRALVRSIKNYTGQSRTHRNVTGLGIMAPMLLAQKLQGTYTIHPRSYEDSNNQKVVAMDSERRKGDGLHNRLSDGPQLPQSKAHP